MMWVLLAALQADAPSAVVVTLPAGDEPLYRLTLPKGYAQVPSGRGPILFRKAPPDGSQRFLQIYLITSKARMTGDTIAAEWIPRGLPTETTRGEQALARWKVETVEFRMTDPAAGPLFGRGEALALHPHSLGVIAIGPVEFEAELRADVRGIVGSAIVGLQAFSREELFEKSGRLQATFWAAAAGTGLYLIAWTAYFRRNADTLDIARTVYLAGAAAVWGTVLYLSWTIEPMLRSVDSPVPRGPYVSGMVLAPAVAILVIVRVMRRIGG